MDDTNQLYESDVFMLRISCLILIVVMSLLIPANEGNAQDALSQEPPVSGTSVTIEYDPEVYAEADFDVTKRAIEKFGCTPVVINKTGYFGEIITVFTNDVEGDVERPSDALTFAAMHCKQQDEASTHPTSKTAHIEFGRGFDELTAEALLLSVANLGCVVTSEHRGLPGTIKITIDDAGIRFKNPEGALLFAEKRCAK